MMPPESDLRDREKFVRAVKETIIAELAAA
jgi:hypothetical protein